MKITFSSVEWCWCSRLRNGWEWRMNFENCDVIYEHIFLCGSASLAATISHPNGFSLNHILLQWIITAWTDFPIKLRFIIKKIQIPITENYPWPQRLITSARYRNSLSDLYTTCLHAEWNSSLRLPSIDCINGQICARIPLFNEGGARVPYFDELDDTANNVIINHVYKVGALWTKKFGKSSFKLCAVVIFTHATQCAVH